VQRGAVRPAGGATGACSSGFRVSAVRQVILLLLYKIGSRENKSGKRNRPRISSNCNWLAGSMRGGRAKQTLVRLGALSELNTEGLRPIAKKRAEPTTPQVIGRWESTVVAVPMGPLATTALTVHAAPDFAQARREADFWNSAYESWVPQK